MQEKRKAGLWTSLILGFYGLAGSFYVFVLSDHWRDMWEAKANQYSADLGIYRLDEVFIVKYVIPALHDLAVIGSILMIVAAYMFCKKYNKAWHVGIIGLVTAILGTGFPIVAAASAGIFPEYSMLFFPILAGFFIYIGYIRKFPGKVVLWSAIVGMTYVLALFNGIAAASRMYQRELLQNAPGLAADTPVFAAVQQLNWISVIGWAIFLIGLLFQKKWIIPAGIFSAILSITGGLPLGIESMASGTTFSMFLVAPAFALIILIYILTRSGERFILDWADRELHRH